MADKGIRQYARRRFLELLPTRVNDRNGNIKFRGTLNSELMEQFGITLASAATHYNDAKHEAQKLAAEKLAAGDDTLSKLLEGLGRPPEKNNGGRKKKVVETPAAEVVTGQPEEPQAQDTPPPAKVKVIQKNGKAGPWEFDTQEEAQAFIDSNAGQFKPKMIIEG